MPSWLPNAISTARVVLIPIWVIVAERQRERLLEGDGCPRAALLGILVAIGFSDVLDGFIARRFGVTSHAGAVLDAVADKLAQVTIITYLTFRALPGAFALPIAFWALLLVRDAVIATGWLTVKRRRGHVVSEHRWHGKAASLLLFATTFCLLAGLSDAVMWALVLATSAVVVGSTADYFRIGLRQLRSAPGVPPA